MEHRVAISVLVLFLISGGLTLHESAWAKTSRGNATARSDDRSTDDPQNKCRKLEDRITAKCRCDMDSAPKKKWMPRIYSWVSNFWRESQDAGTRGTVVGTDWLNDNIPVELECAEGELEFSERTSSTRSRESTPSGCLEILEEARIAGCFQSKNRDIGFTCGESVEQSEPLFSCQSLRNAEALDWTADIEKKKEALVSYYRQWLDPLGNPDDAHFTEEGNEPSQGASPRSPLKDPGASNIGELEDLIAQPLPENKMRLEIPGNFIRFMIASTVLPKALSQLNAILLEQDPTMRSKFDTRELTGTLDPIALAPIGTFSRNDVLNSRCESDDLSEAEERALGCDDAEVVTHAQRLSDGSVRVSGNYEDRGFKVSWDGIDFKTEEPLRIDFKNEHHLQLTAAHQPETESRAFEHFRVMTDIPDAFCQAIFDWKINKIRPNAKYFPWAQLFYARCDSPDTHDDDNDANNFVIYDPTPRHYMNDFLEIFRASNPGLKVHCSSPLLMEGPHGRFNFEEFVRSRPTMSEERKSELLEKAPMFGCGNVRFSYRVPVNEITYDKASYSAVTLRGLIHPPKLSATIDLQVIKIEAAFLISVSEKLRERVWTAPLGWIVRIVERILSGFLTVAGTYLVNVTGFLGNKVEVVFIPIVYQIEGVVTHQLEREEGIFQSVAIRRIESDPPTVNSTDVSVDFSFDRCSPKEFWKGPSKLIKLVVGCPLQQWGNAVRFVIGKVVGGYILHLDLLLEAIAQPMIQGLVMEEGGRELRRLTDHSKLASLMEQAQKSVLYNPHELLPTEMTEEERGRFYSFVPDGDNPENNAVTLPPVVAQVCSIAQLALTDQLDQSALDAACLLAQTLTGLTTKYVDLSFKIDRIGSKMHYRSLVNNLPGVIDNLSAIEPATYYCGYNYGNFAPGDAYSPGQFGDLTDFREVDRAGAANNPRIDYTTQCSLFFDFDFVAGVVLHGTRDDELTRRVLEENFGAELTGEGLPIFIFRANLTRLSQLLLNEVFVCESSAQCATTREPIRKRAQEAMCSLINDLRFEVKEGERELLSLSLIDAAETFPDLVKEGLNYLDRSNPQQAQRVRQFVGANQAVVDEVIEWITECPEILKDYIPQS